MGVDVGPKLCAVRSILLMYQPASSSSLRGTSSPPLPLSPLLPLSTSPPFPSLLILYTSLRPSPLLQFVRSPLLRTPFSIAYGLLPCVWPLYIAHFEQYFCLQVCCPPLPSPLLPLLLSRLNFYCSFLLRTAYHLVQDLLPCIQPTPSPCTLLSRCAAFSPHRIPPRLITPHPPAFSPHRRVFSPHPTALSPTH